MLHCVWLLLWIVDDSVSLIIIIIINSSFLHIAYTYYYYIPFCYYLKLKIGFLYFLNNNNE
jgi:hypothetical protein